MESVIHIKNMVCNRCIKVVREELEKLNLKVDDVLLGKAVIQTKNGDLPMKKIEQVLIENGFELIDPSF